MERRTAQSPSLFFLSPEPPPLPPSRPPQPPIACVLQPARRGDGGGIQEDGVKVQSKKTVSRCTVEKVKGTHIFDIEGYSLKKGIGVGEFVRSATFTVGGSDWSVSVQFYPDGATTEVGKEHASIYLELMSSNVDVRAMAGVRLVNKDLHWRKFMKKPEVLNRDDTWLVHFMVQRLKLERLVQDDRLVIECVVTVLKHSQVYQDRGCSELEVPPSNIADQLGELLKAKEEADVTFSVGGESFKAHRLLLAMRSPVFKAELYGPMREARMPLLTIQDMQPAVFSALLQFIYTDALPDFGELEGDDRLEMIRHLLVAADRYAVDRLKLICQSILGGNLDVETVATTLALADKHNCGWLKDVCIEFIASSDQRDAVVATKGYANLKRTCPSVLVDLFERTTRTRSSF